MTAEPRAAGVPGVVIRTTDVAAANVVAAGLAQDASVDSAALHVATTGGHALVRATGEPSDLIARMLPVADLGCWEVRDRALVHHRVTWAPGNPTPGVGSIYRIRRNPALTADGFHAHWEQRHGPLALAHHLGMWDYHQLSVVRTVAGDDLDGVAVVQWPTAEDLETRFTDGPDGAAAIDRDASVFTDRKTLAADSMTEIVVRAPTITADRRVRLTDHRSHEIAADADTVWALLGDFGAILRWWPSGLDACEVDDPVVPTRRVLTRSDGGAVVEELVHHRPGERMFVLRVVSGFADAIGDYRCRYEIRPTGDASCRLDWQPRAEVDASGVASFEAVVDRGWDQVVTGLRAAFAPGPP